MTYKLVCTGVPWCTWKECPCGTPHFTAEIGCLTVGECRHADGRRVQCREARPDPAVVGSVKRRRRKA